MLSKISIIVPVYNVESFLERCVDSLLHQTHNNTEIILVNDGSPDNSGEICDTYAKKHQNIKTIHRENGGLSAARNSGLKIATGDYISFVDSDDWIHPEMMSVMLDAIKEHKANIAECDLITANEYYIKPINSEEERVVFKETRLDALKRIITNLRFSACVRLYEHDLIKGLRFPEGTNSEDVYFSLLVFERVDSLVRIPDQFYYYYENSESITRRPYSLKKFDSLNSGLHLQKTLNASEEDPELLNIIKHHILRKLLYHYKLLNYNSHLDTDYGHRKRIKKLIQENYFKSSTHHYYLRFANYFPVKVFEILIKWNEWRHKILKTNQFS